MSGVGSLLKNVGQLDYLNENIVKLKSFNPNLGVLFTGFILRWGEGLVKLTPV